MVRWDFSFPLTSPVYLTRHEIKLMQRTSCHRMKKSKFKDRGFFFIYLMIFKLSLAEKHLSNCIKVTTCAKFIRTFVSNVFSCTSFVDIFKNVAAAPGAEFPNAGQ